MIQSPDSLQISRFVKMSPFLSGCLTFVVLVRNGPLCENNTKWQNVLSSVVFFFITFTVHFFCVPSATFWASRGHRCLPFSLPVWTCRHLYRPPGMDVPSFVSPTGFSIRTFQLFMLVVLIEFRQQLALALSAS